MDDELSVAVPRNLRVGATVAHTIADTTIRLRVPVFLWLSGTGIAAVLLLVSGAGDAVALLLVVGAAGAGLLEARPWGYSCAAFGQSIVRYLRTPRELLLEPLVLTLPAAGPSTAPLRRPRWDMPPASSGRGAQ